MMELVPVGVERGQPFVATPVGPPRPPAERNAIPVGGRVIELQHVLPLRMFRDLLKDVVVVAAGQGVVEEVRGRKQVEDRKPVLVQHVRRDGPVREAARLVGRGAREPGRRIADEHRLVVDPALREVPLPLELCRDGDGPGVARLADSPVFTRVEEEQLVAVGVEAVRNVDGPAERPAERVVPVQRLGLPPHVVEEIVRVELLVALEPVGAPTELARP